MRLERNALIATVRKYEQQAQNTLPVPCRPARSVRLGKHASGYASLTEAAKGGMAEPKDTTSACSSVAVSPLRDRSNVRRPNSAHDRFVQQDNNLHELHSNNENCHVSTHESTLRSTKLAAVEHVPGLHGEPGPHSLVGFATPGCQSPDATLVRMQQLQELADSLLM